MRILLITDNHTPTGGAEHYFFDLKKRLKQVADLEVYSLGFGTESQAGDDFYVLKGNRSKAAQWIWQIIFHPFVYFKLRRYLIKIRPDIIHLHNIKQYSASLLHAIKSYPVVQTIHDYGAVCPVAYNIHKDNQACETGFKKACFWQHHVKHSLVIYLARVFSFFNLRRKQQKIIKKFFAPSPLLVDYLKKNQFHDAIYIAPFKKEAHPYSFNKINPYHFLFAGNLGTHKGVYLLLEEFALAHQKNPQLTLTLAGTGQEEGHLRKRIHEMGLTNPIFFTGWKSNLDSEYEHCAAVIFPSLWMEAFGLVITEAMSYARPVIGTNRGSPAWLIQDKETGFIFDPLIKGDLAQKLLQIAGNSELIQRLGQQGRDKLETFIDNEKILEQIIKHYRNAYKNDKSNTKKGA